MAARIRVIEFRPAVRAGGQVGHQRGSPPPLLQGPRWRGSEDQAASGRQGGGQRWRQPLRLQLQQAGRWHQSTGQLAQKGFQAGAGPGQLQANAALRIGELALQPQLPGQAADRGPEAHPLHNAAAQQPQTLAGLGAAAGRLVRTATIRLSQRAQHGLQPPPAPA
jgi:hypothetical protein